MRTTLVRKNMANLEEKLNQTRSILRELGRVGVAFSAGVDSTLVLKIAVDTLGPGNVVAVTGQSDSVARTELEDAGRLAAEIGAEHVVIETGEFENKEYTSNPVNRCYFCKTTLYGQLKELIAQRGWRAIVNGTNVDDWGDYRPGLKAADEFQVRSPLAEAGLTKREIRTLSARLGLPTFDKPASPCLSSRVQYGEEITPDKLRRIESAEAYLRQFGINECRVRHHNDLARIEVSPAAFAEICRAETASQIDRYFRSLGYHYVTLDLRGFRSGSLNDVIAFGRRQG